MKAASTAANVGLQEWQVEKERIEKGDFLEIVLTKENVIKSNPLAGNAGRFCLYPSQSPKLLSRRDAVLRQSKCSCGVPNPSMLNRLIRHCLPSSVLSDHPRYPQNLPPCSLYGPF